MIAILISDTCCQMRMCSRKLARKLETRDKCPLGYGLFEIADRDAALTALFYRLFPSLSLSLSLPLSLFLRGYLSIERTMDSAARIRD
jgi:hypothetical protein